MRKITLLFLSVLTLAACTKTGLNLPADSNNNINLNTLLTLKSGVNNVFTQDYILNVSEIDSISIPGSNAALSADKTTITLNITPETPAFFNTTIWVKGVPYAVPCRKTDKVDYTFTYNPQGKTFKKVQIAGQMNDWAPVLSPDLVLNDKGLYEVTLNLSPGTYLYQMVLDGDQNHDANNPNKVDNGYGKFNSILQVEGNSDKFPVLHTDKIENGKFTISAENNATKIFVYWQNYLLPENFVKNENGIITINIPMEAEKLDRSFIRVWSMNEWGTSNDLLIPLQKGNVLTNAADITRQDRHAQIMYFMLIDRFKNGNKQNDKPMNRPDVNPKVDFFGGDLAGVKDEIQNDYFKKLGTNTLWISPVNQNPEEPYGYYAPKKTKFSGYHGYWPISSSKVDHRFGTNQELKDLVSTAHDKNMNVLLDYVAHHIHELHPLFKQHPEFFTSLYLPDGTLNTERWNDHRLTTWFDTFMPTFDLANPKVISMMSDSAMYWLNEFKLDGFRHDACKHITEEFWRALTLKIKQNNNGKGVYQIGETYGSPELIGSYLNTGMLDGQFDFNVFDEASTTLEGVGVPNMQRIYNVLQTSFNTYGYHNLMGYISGNHDKPRFMAYASGDLKFGEDSKAAGWNRDIGITDSTAYDKMALMQTFIMTIPGVPVIYYGDEIGMTGANDPDCRRMMRFEGLNNRETKLWNQVATLTHLRSENPVLIYGDFINLKAETDSWAYARKYFDKEAIVLINNSKAEKKLEITLPASLKNKNFKATFKNKFKISDGKLQLTLPAYSAEVLI